MKALRMVCVLSVWFYRVMALVVAVSVIVGLAAAAMGTEPPDPIERTWLSYTRDSAFIAISLWLWAGMFQRWVTGFDEASRPKAVGE